MLRTICSCGSDKTFENCCRRFLRSGQWAKTPEQLMRSRYTAYALGGYGEYLLATWFPATAQGLTAQALSQPGNDWIELQLLHKSQNGDRGAVEFNAWYRDDDGQPAVLHEKSVFTRSGGRWYYVGGEVEAVPG